MCNYVFVFTIQLLAILLVTRTVQPEKFVMMEPVFVVTQLTLPLVRIPKCARAELAEVCIIIEHYVHCLTQDLYFSL